MKRANSRIRSNMSASSREGSSRGKIVQSASQKSLRKRIKKLKNNDYIEISRGPNKLSNNSTYTGFDKTTPISISSHNGIYGIESADKYLG